MIIFLRFLFSALFVWMIYIVLSTCFESNLFSEWSDLAKIPWLTATLWDFYANTVIISLWAMYKERSFMARGVWVILFIVLGSIATSAYILRYLFSLSKDDGIEKLILRDASSNPGIR
jgi:hypothetical protein